MSQERLGEAIGLTFQQVQKYERGSNRISAGTLFRLSQVLDVPVSFFFDSYDHTHSSTLDPDGAGISRRDARLLRLWRAAPPMIADEVLALLASLSPHLPDGMDDEAAPIVMARPLLAAEHEEVMDGVRTLVANDGGRIDGIRPIKARAEKGGPRPRRRHGAVWDPADIYRTVKPPAERG